MSELLTTKQTAMSVRNERLPAALGWVAVAVSLVFSCLWTFWGTIENFHEGWYYTSIWQNLGMMFVQYLSPALLFILLTVVAILFPRIGATLHLVFGVCLAAFLSLSITVITIILPPLVALAALYWFGRPKPRLRAIFLAIGLPTVTFIMFGAEPFWRVATRFDDGNLDSRAINGNGISLAWAPDGPGWPHDGMNWTEASYRCKYLTADGAHLADTPQNIWRLPTVDEAVRSMMRHGGNGGGKWNVATGNATYRIPPDKESPLWNTHTKIIYWWTATEIDKDSARIIAYDGKVWSRRKSVRYGYLGFRAVKSPVSASPN